MVGIVAAVTVATAAYSIHEGKKAKKAAKSSNAAQRRINQLRNKQSKRKFLRQFRQVQAEAIQGAISAGVGIESSLAQGTLASQGSQARIANLEFEKMDELGGEMTAAMDRQASAQFRSQVGSTVSSFASQFMGWKPGGA